MRKGNIKNIVLMVTIITIMMIGCKEVSVSSPESNSIPINLNLQIFGKNNLQRIYLETISKINLQTNKPVIIPPDSIKDVIKFPDSLYNQGIFIYSSISERNEIIGDTLKIFEDEKGYNLFNIINSYPSNGEYQSYCTWKYFADTNKIYVGEKPNAKLLFEIPLKLNNIYASPFDTIKIIDTVQLKIKAGNFNTYKIERNQTINEDMKYQVFQYIVPDVGVVLVEEKFISIEIDNVTGQIATIVQFRRRELISYN